ncbi:MAG: transcriptional repressor, partial [Clostridia bacterium]|nr:transcriptional repressor [Clostridia bacterium]
MNREKLSAELRQSGLCPTQQRIAVYEYLIQHRTHPTADMVYRALEKEHPSL